MVSSLLHRLLVTGSARSLQLNLKKCKVFWPSGYSLFPEFPDGVQRELSECADATAPLMKEIGKSCWDVICLMNNRHTNTNRAIFFFDALL